MTNNIICSNCGKEITNNYEISQTFYNLGYMWVKCKDCEKEDREDNKEEDND